MKAAGTSSRSWARGGAVGFFLLFLLAVTWPGMVPFNRVRPFLLGLPFSMAWIALWVLGSFLVLLLLDLMEDGGRGKRGEPSRPQEGSEGAE